MRPEPSPRQVLYALVAGGFHLVVGILAWGSSGLAPSWWNATVVVVWVAVSVVVVWRWRKTGMVLGLTMGEFVLWTIGAAVLLS